MMKKDPAVIVALDIGRVCISLDYESCLRGFGFEPDENFPIPRTILEANNELECGRISVRSFLDVMHRETNGKFTDGQIIENWNKIIGKSNPGMKERVSALVEKGVRFVYFSDISIIHADEMFRRNDFAHRIADAVFSFEAGAQKPDPAMYELFEKRHGIPDFYFDDKLCNIQQAASRGWNAIQFFNAEQLEVIQ